MAAIINSLNEFNFGRLKSGLNAFAYSAYAEGVPAFGAASIFLFNVLKSGGYLLLKWQAPSEEKSAGGQRKISFTKRH